MAPQAFPELVLAVADLLPPGGPEREQERAEDRSQSRQRGAGQEPLVRKFLHAGRGVIKS